MQAAGYSANFSFASAGGIDAVSANLGGAGSNEGIAGGAGNSGGNGDAAGADADAYVENPIGDVDMEQAFSEVPDSAIRKKLQFVPGYAQQVFHS